MAGLGRILQQQRLSQGLSLEEAERATHISRRYLQALEEEEFTVFSSPVFAKGFLRNYSQYLGLDPTQVLTLWPESGEAPPVAQPAETARTDFERRSGPIRDRTPYRRALPSSDAPSPLSRRRVGHVETTPMGGVVALVGAIVVGLVVIAFAASRLAGNGRNVQVPSSGSVPAATAVGGARPQSSPTAPPRRAGAMPDLKGKDAAAAIQQLIGSGVNPLVITVAPARNQRPGVVTNQDPAAGATLNTNSPVTVVITGAAPASTVAPATIAPRASTSPRPAATPRVP